MSMITIYIWIFVILCVLALFGFIALLFCLNVLVIEPIRDFICNHKRYKEFYDEHYGEWLNHKFDKEDDEAEENE